MRIKLFAGAREAAGADTADIELDLPASILSISQALASQHPALAPFVGFSRFAVGNAFVELQYIVTPDDLKDEIALIPPVSGG